MKTNPYDRDPPPDPNLIAEVNGIPSNSYTLIRFHDLATVELRIGIDSDGKNLLVPVKRLDALVAALLAAREKAVRIGTLEGVSPLSQAASRVSREASRVSREKEARRQRLEERHKAEARRLHKLGFKVADMNIRGRSYETIASWLGLDLPKVDRPTPPQLRLAVARAPAEKVAEAIALHGQQVPPDEIAKRLGVGRATVYRWIKTQQKPMSAH